MWGLGGDDHTMLPPEHDERMKSVVEEAFELQVYQPFHGWVYDGFCDRSGNMFPALTAAAARIKTEDKLNPLSDQRELEISTLLKSGWMWTHPWIPDFEYTQCDEEGWSYGSTIARINRRLAEGSSKIKREYYHFLRRRRWIRTRILTPVVSSSAACRSEASSTTIDETPTIGPLPPLPTQQQQPPTRGSNKRYYRMYRDSVFSHFRFGPTPPISNFVQNEFTDDDVLREGWLGQRGTFSRSWKLRYYLLRQDTSMLVCLRDRASLVQISEEPIDRTTSLIIEESPNPQQFQFLVINGQHQLRLNAVDAACRASWISAISELIVRKRASFLAAEDSEASMHNGSGRGGRILRRMRSSKCSDDGVWNALAAARMTTDAMNRSQRDEQNRPTRKRIWRPYRLISSTMHSKIEVNQTVRQEYLTVFEGDFAQLVATTRDFLEQNLDILEDNLLVTEQLLTSVVAKVPEEEIDKLRDAAAKCIDGLEQRFRDLMTSGRANVLQCNMLRKLAYSEARRVNDMILSFAPPPVVHTKIKKVAPSSPPKRQIPTDWFMGHTPILDDKSSVKSASTIAQRRRQSDLSFTTMSESGTPTSMANRPSHGPAEMKIKRFRELPAALSEGHMELPSGVNDYVLRVHEHDLGSLIAFTLTSKAYVEAVEAQFEREVKIDKELVDEEYTMGSRKPAESNANGASGLSSPTEILYLNKLRSQDVQHTEDKFTYEASGIKHEFRCVTFFAAQFHALRALTGAGNVDFLCSLAESRRWEAMGGKSKAFFSMTHDKRFVLKGIPAAEFNMFVHMAPHYFKFMSRLVKCHNPTVITKILGLYKVTHCRRGHKHTNHVVVMENIVYGFPAGQIYDIKGITRRRYSVRSEDDDSEHHTGDSVGSSMAKSPMSSCRPMLSAHPVLLDGNLMERIPIPIRQTDLDTIESAIQNDTGFLCRAGVIDYSMIMLFDEENRQVVVGLIDYLHQFDFLKKMESTSKASLTFRNPTIISPISYRRRFVNAMHRYLVGIEPEVELRIRQRNHRAKSTHHVPAILPSTAHEDGSQDEGVSIEVKHADGEDHANGNLPEALQPSVRVKAVRSISDHGVQANHVYDRDAAHAHSDGEQFGSFSSDEACLRESAAVISSVWHDKDDRESTDRED